ncbi:ABC transporter substrate-binding protein [Aestuariispira ectoiniformans]|uniref:ABC transporter substrate-binding protein n=1 Tax=Aestuariispira ectoiniformans TaxID=2775080 RepID=UPI00223B484E|nr:ABC transporter substrate-binding protein [Aestuariispira ectoiniformans]
MRRLTTMARILACLTLAGWPVGDVQAEVLHIFSATDTAAIQPVIDGFEKAHPDLTVDYVEFNTSELHTAILEDTSAPVDVVISSAMDLQVDLVNRGLAQRFTPAMDAPPDWAQWRNELYGFTFEPVAVVYNRAAFQGRRLPRTRSQLAGAIRDDPAFYNGRIGTYDIAQSGVGFLFAAQDARRGYQFPRLVESLGRAHAKTYCCSYKIFDAVADGSLVFGYNVMGSYALERTQRDKRLGIYLLEDYALVMTRTAFIPKRSENKDDAKAFINYLLSSRGQRKIAEGSALIAIRQEQRTAPGIVALTSGKPLLPIRLGPGLLGYLDKMKKEQFLKDWRTTMAGPPNQ